MGKSLMRQRREVGAVCYTCSSPDYEYLHNNEYDFQPIAPRGIKGVKPTFRCKSCGSSWQWGDDGGKFMRLLFKED